MKKTLTSITLAIVLMFGATLANAGIIVTDSPAPSTSTDKSGIIILKDGIIILKDGIIILAATAGIIIL